MVYMTAFLSEEKHKYPETVEEYEATISNITLSTLPYIPFTVYFCYSLPEKIDLVWVKHYEDFESFKDFQYGFMQNLLGNILSFMDVFEKSAAAAEVGDYITVVRQLGRAIRRSLIFDSMMSEPLGEVLDPNEGEVWIKGKPYPASKWG